MRKYDIIAIGKYQFLIDIKASLYAGTYDLCELREEYEVLAFDVIKQTDINISNIARYVQALTAALIKYTATDGFIPLEITTL